MPSARVNKYEFAISQSISGSFKTNDSVEASFLAKGNSAFTNTYLTQFVDLEYSVSSESIELKRFPKGTFPERFYVSDEYVTQSFSAGIPENLQYVQFTLTGSIDATGSHKYSSGSARYNDDLQIDYDKFELKVHQPKTELTDSGLLVFTSPNKFIKANADGVVIKGGEVDAEKVTTQQLEVFGDATIFGDVTATANSPFDDTPKNVATIGNKGESSLFARGDHQHNLPFDTLNAVAQEGEFTNVSGSITSTGSFGHLRVLGLTQPDIKIFSSSLSSTTTTLEETLASEQTNIDNLHIATGSLEGRVSALEIETGSLDSRITSNDNEISNLHTATGSLEGRIDKLELETGSLDSRITSNDNDISNLQSTLTAEQTNIDNLQTDSSSFSTRISTEEDNVDALQAIQILGGAGLTGGGALTSNQTLVVGAGTGVTVNDNDIAIGQDVATTADVTFNKISASVGIDAPKTGSFGFVHALGVSDTFAAAVISEIDNDEIPIAKLSSDAITIAGQSTALGETITADTIAGQISNDTISGDQINTGTIDSITITDLAVTKTGSFGEAGGDKVHIHADGNHSHIVAQSNPLLLRTERAVDTIELKPNNTDVMIISASGRVGIGTTSPDGQLDISTAGSPDIIFQTTADSSQQVDLILKGSRTTSTTDPINTIQFRTNDNQSGAENLGYIYSYKDETSTNKGVIAFGTTATDGGSPAERMRIDSSGNVSIGTTTQRGPLRVVSSDSGNVSSIYIGDNSSDDSGHGLLYSHDMTIGSDVDVRIISDANTATPADGADIIFGAGTNINLDSSANWPVTAIPTIASTHMIIKAGSGKVGIGTTSPDNKLHLHQGDSTANYLQITNTTTGEGADDGFQIGIDADETAVIFQKEDNHMRFGTNNSETMRITNDGKVGINQTNPGGTLPTGFSAASPKVLEIQSTTTATDVGLLLRRPGGATGMDLWSDSDNGKVFIDSLHNDDDSYMIFRTKTLSGASNETEALVIRGDGDIGIGTDSPSERLDVRGNIKTTGNISSPSFFSGFAGSGFRITSGSSTDSAGNSYGSASKSSLQIDDLTVRGTMNVFELLIHQIRATNGSIFVSNTGKIISSSLDDGDKKFSLFFDTGSQYGHSFRPGDLIRAQRFKPDSNGSGSQVFKSDLHVISTNVTHSLVAVLTGSDAPELGYEYVRIGNTTDADRQGSIYLTADDDHAPFIDVADTIQSHDDFNTSDRVKVRIGKLDGITTANAAFGTLDKYGFYASGSAYLEGSIFADKGSIGGFTIGSDTLTTTNAGIGKAGQSQAFFAGSDTPNSAAFRVAHDGTLVASSATITGNIIATGGTLGGFTIDDNKISSDNLVLSSSTTQNDLIISTSKFQVDGAGGITASAADISGILSSSAGNIGGFSIDTNEIKSKDNNFKIDSSNSTLQVGSVTDFTNDDTSKKGFFVQGTGELFIGQEQGDFIHFNPSTNELEISSSNINVEVGDLQITASDIDMTTDTFELSASGMILDSTGPHIELGQGNDLIKLEGSSNPSITIGSSNAITLFAGDSNDNYIAIGDKTTLADYDDTSKAGIVFGRNNSGTRLGIGNDADNLIEFDESNLILKSTNTTLKGESIEISSSKFRLLNGSITASNGNFSGSLFSTDANISGILSASEGNIGGFTINEDTIESGNGSLVISASARTLKFGSIGLTSADDFGPNASPNVGAFFDGSSGKFLLKSTATQGIQVTPNKVSVQADTFLLGNEGSDRQFISGSNNKLEISSSNFHLKPNGDVIISGSGIFGGDLVAAGGTFSGDLSAAGGTFSGDLSAVGGTFSGELSAVTGEFSGSISASSGMIGGFEIASTTISSKTGTLILRNDGQITASAVSMSGTIVSSDGQIGGWDIGTTLSSGTAIVLDPGNNRITLNNKTAPLNATQGVYIGEGTVDQAGDYSIALGDTANNDGGFVASVGSGNDYVMFGEIGQAISNNNDINIMSGSFISYKSSNESIAISSKNFKMDETGDIQISSSGDSAQILLDVDANKSQGIEINSDKGIFGYGDKDGASKQLETHGGMFKFTSAPVSIEGGAGGQGWPIDDTSDNAPTSYGDESGNQAGPGGGYSGT